jgi:threonine synthase
MLWTGIIDQYYEYLPIKDKKYIVSLNEGNTPLIRALQAEREMGGKVKIYLKYEGLNPTGSFKDRGMTVAVSKALEDGSKSVICASTGNTAASAASYAAKAGLKAYILLPKEKVALGKLSQALIHGAKVVQINGGFDQALKLVRDIVENYPVTLVNSLNPNRIEGQKTASFEIVDQLGKSPTYHVLPVGNAGNITAYWKGYREYMENGRINSLPRMIGFQAKGAAPIVRGKPIDNPETIATAIRIGNPARWREAENAIDESGGIIDIVTDEEILIAYKFLAAKEGVFCELASAASIAGVLKLGKNGFFEKNALITCTITGHGLKDPGIACDQTKKPEVAPPTMDGVLKVINLGFEG